MKRSFRIRLAAFVVAGVLAPLAGNPVFAQSGNLDHLIGMWEGVDALDGSTVRVSIGDMERDKRLEFRWHESFFTGCFNGDDLQGRGIISGTVQRLNEDEIELVVSSFKCFDVDNNAVEVSNFSVDLRYSWKDDILTRNSTAEFPGFILYRTSSKGY